MLAGIYYGAQYGGSTTAILVNLPGESSSVVTCIDGYQMARQRPRRRRARHRGASARSSPAAFATLLIAAFARAAGRTGVQVRTGRILLADGAGPDRRRRARLGSLIKAIGDDRARPAARHRRHRREFGCGALLFRHPRTHRWHRLRCRGDGRVRLHRNRRQRRAPRASRGLHRQGDEPAADPRRSEGGRAGDRPRHTASAPRSASCRAAARCCRRSPPTRWRRSCAASRAKFRSARAPSTASPVRSRPTTPARRRASSRC